MAFNKKSLVRLAILSSILGLNGFCDVANAGEKIYRPMDGEKGNVVGNKNDVNKDEAEEEGIFTCGICMCDVTFREKKKDRFPIIHPCGHVYHSDCISGWRKSNNTCPMCKRKTVKDEIKEVTVKSCAECGGAIDEAPFYTTSGRAICGLCLMNLVNVDHESQNAFANADKANPLCYKVSEEAIEKYKLTQADRRNMQNAFDSSGLPTYLSTDRFLQVPPSEENPIEEKEKNNGNNFLTKAELEQAEKCLNEAEDFQLDLGDPTQYGLDNQAAHYAKSYLDAVGAAERAKQEVINKIYQQVEEGGPVDMNLFAQNENLNNETHDLNDNYGEN